MYKRNCVERLVCYNRVYEEYLQHGSTHGPHCFSKLDTSTKQWISISELGWVLGTLSFAVFALTYSFVDCPFYAKLFYFTNWGLIASNIYFLIRAVSNLYNRYKQGYYFLLYNKKTKQDEYRMSQLGIFLWGITMQFQLIVWVWETTIFAIYWFFGGNEVTLDLISISAHLVMPILIWIDIWASAIPFPIEHVYRIPAYAAIYPTFGTIHYIEGWGHLSSSCPDSYYTSITLGQNYVYSQLNYAFSSTYLYIIAIICLCVALGFATYWLKKCTEEDNDDEEESDDDEL